MSDYRSKYHKYKHKYLSLKQKAGTYDKKVDLNLFFDLLQASVSILEKTVESDIIILIGETPAYLRPILEKERKVINLALSDKAFGCFIQGYGIPIDLDAQFDKIKGDLFERNRKSGYFDEMSDEELWKFVEYSNIARSLIPTKENFLKYTKYLDEETELTKKLLKERWGDIVLIDSSSGRSILGASNFLNRYVENIDPNTPCHQIEGAKPIKYIEITYHPNITYLNLNPEKHVETLFKYENKYLINYDSKLLTLIGVVGYRHTYNFFLSEYPRYVPFHPPSWWNKKPGEGAYKGYGKDALENLEVIKKLLDYYNSYKETCVKLEKEDKERLIRFAKYIADLPNLNKSTKKMLDSISKDQDQKKICQKLSLLFTKINKEMIYEKYNVLEEYKTWENKVKN